MKYAFLSVAVLISPVPASNAATITETPDAQSAFDQYRSLALEFQCRMELAKGEQTTDEVDTSKIQNCIRKKITQGTSLFPTPKRFNE